MIKKKKFEKKKKKLLFKQLLGIYLPKKLQALRVTFEILEKQ